MSIRRWLLVVLAAGLGLVCLLTVWAHIGQARARGAWKAVAVAQDVRTELLLQASYVDDLVAARQRGDSSSEQETTQLIGARVETTDALLHDLRHGGGEASLPVPPESIRAAHRAVFEQWALYREAIEALLQGRSVLRNRDFVHDTSKELAHSLSGISASYQRFGDAAFGWTRAGVWAVLLIVLAGAGVATALCVAGVFRPLQTAVDWLELLSSGRVPAGVVLPISRRGELGRIGKHLNTFVERLQEADQTKDRFLATMSHEIRTPLNGVIGFLTNLQDTNLNEQQGQYVKLIDSSARALLRVINEILDFSKITAGKLELEIVAFDLRRLIDERLAVTRQLAQGKRLRVSADIEGPEEMVVRGDPTRLRQVLDNLLSNAVKFTEHGDIRIGAVYTESGNGEVSLAFSVSDTGIGMTPQQQERLFTAFMQAETSTTRKYGGTGLGLCIAANLVSLMGGQLRVHSQPGEGTRFDFAFTTSKARPQEKVQLSEHYTIRIPRGALRKFWALLVDDTPTNLFLMETICQGIGLPYRTAVNGQEAVDLVKRQRFDLIFMDIQMPVMDGYTAIREIRRLENAATTQIIALTASAFQEDVDRALGAGSTGFMAKPFERNQLMLCIAEHLGVPVDRELRALAETPETGEDMLVRHMYDFMREQYQVSLGEIKMILAQSVADWRPLLDDLTVFAKKHNWVEVRAIMHRLKGQLGAIGLPQFADVSATINERIKADDTEGLEVQVEEFVNDLGALFRVVESDITLEQVQAGG